MLATRRYQGTQDDQLITTSLRPLFPLRKRLPIFIGAFESI